MNTPLHALLACALFFAANISHATPGPQVRVDVQMVSVPLAKAAVLLPDLRDSAKIDAAWAQVQKMIAGKEATLVAWPEVFTKSGQRAVSESVREHRYAAGFFLPIDAQIEQPKPGPDAPEPDKQRAVENVAARQSAAFAIGQFETRNVGSTLELEPMIAPDRVTIDLNLVSQYVRLAGTHVTAIGRDRSGKETQIEQPTFQSAKVTTSLSVNDGQRVLLGSFEGQEKEGHLLIFVLHAEVVKPPPAPAK